MIDSEVQTEQQVYNPPFAKQQTFGSFRQESEEKKDDEELIKRKEELTKKEKAFEKYKLQYFQSEKEHKELKERIKDLEEELEQVNEHGTPEEIRQKAKEELQKQVTTIIDKLKSNHEVEKLQMKDEADQKDNEIMKLEKNL